MKKNYAKVASAFFMAAMAMNVSAQQIPNGGFEDGWAFRTPYLTVRTQINSSYAPEKVQSIVEDQIFIAPASWDVSNNIGVIVSNNEFDNPIKVAERVSKAHSGKYAIQITDKKSEPGPSFMIPGFVSLGTTWFSCAWSADVDWGFMVIPGSSNNHDWGSFGGAELTTRPDAISFYYTREGAKQDATVVAYLWKGTYTQKEVSSIIVAQPFRHVAEFPAGSYDLGGGATNEEDWPSVDMNDRDRSILGMETVVGDTVFSSEDAELIASATARISDTPGEWTLFECPLEYKSDATPEKINIIIAAGDYFGPNSNFVDGNSITVDDVTAVYYSRLKAISVKGQEFALENGKYDYEIDADLPQESDLKIEVLGQHAEIVERTSAGNKLTIKVKNAVGNDSDGLNEHTYSFLFTGDGTGVENVEMGNTPVEYFNLQGVRVDNAASGLYIRRQGDKTEKVIIR